MKSFKFKTPCREMLLYSFLWFISGKYHFCQLFWPWAWKMKLEPLWRRWEYPCELEWRRCNSYGKCLSLNHCCMLKDRSWKTFGRLVSIPPDYSLIGLFHFRYICKFIVCFLQCFPLLDLFYYSFYLFIYIWIFVFIYNFMIH